MIHRRRLFSLGECTDLIGEMKTARLKNGAVFSGAGNKRKSSLAWLPKRHWAVTRLQEFGTLAAGMAGIDIDDGQPDAAQYTVYRPDGFYDVHADIDYGENNMRRQRKLSITVRLAGEQTITLHYVPTPELQVGDAVAFPSYLPHNVGQASEERISLVAWLTGPAWR